MNAKDLARKASLENTESRVEKVIAQAKADAQIIPVTTFEGVDADTGRAKFSQNNGCGSEAIALGESITTGGLPVGSTVLARGTEGNTRLDRRPTNSLSTECGTAGQPNPRFSSTPGGSGNEELNCSQKEGDVVPGSEQAFDTGRVYEVYTGNTVTNEFGFPECETEVIDERDCSERAGEVVPGTERTVGMAKVYEVYTGEALFDEEGNFLDCETEEVEEPNEEELDEDTCPPAPGQPVPRCQWYDSTKEQAESFSGAPEGMFVSGFVEFPPGVFKIIACTRNDEPAPEVGIGRDWEAGNALEYGDAAPDTDYCGDRPRAELIINGQRVVTASPPIRYAVENAGGTNCLIINNELVCFDKEIADFSVLADEDRLRLYMSDAVGIISGTCTLFYADTVAILIDIGFLDFYVIETTNRDIYNTTLKFTVVRDLIANGQISLAQIVSEATLNDGLSPVDGCPGTFSVSRTILANGKTTSRFGGYFSDTINGQLRLFVEPFILTVFFVDDTTTTLEFEESPIVTLAPSSAFQATVSDATGEIATIQSETEPQASYVCRTNDNPCEP